MKFVTAALLGILFTMSSCNEDIEPPVPEFQVTKFSPLPLPKLNGMKIYAHYMPWFEDKTTSSNGNWGWHWTMNNQNPDITDTGGNRQIASHYYPLIGPYASSDPDLIEYHLLLMKYSGIDGVLIDWYGSTNVADYGLNRRNTEALIEMIDEVGLKYAIVYEDRTVERVLTENGGEATSIARNDMLYLSQKYFNQESYIKIDGKPLLLVFGPTYFFQATEWDFIMSALSPKPVFMPLWGNSYMTGTTTAGEFIWVDQTNIDTKYGTIGAHAHFAGGAWPGFRDFYKEGAAGNNLFVIEHDNGQTWNDLLQKATLHDIDFLQLITWNDFGEGTMIEPTKEFGYSYLTKLQSFAGTNISLSELENIKMQYDLRKALKDDKTSLKALDQAFYYWVSLQTDKAEHLIDSLSTKAPLN